MPFAEKGFLGSEVESWVAGIRGTYSEHFSLAAEMHHFAHQSLKKATVPAEANDEQRRRLVSIALFVKIQNSFASVVRLCERGLCSDAEIILRSMFNAMLIQANLRLSPKFLKEFLTQEFFHKRRQLEELYEDDPEFVKTSIGLDDAGVVASLAEYRKEIEQSGFKKEYSVMRLAKDAELKSAYSLMYRSLSGTEHSSLDSVSRHFKFSKEGTIENLSNQPQNELIPFVLNQAVIVFGAALDNYCALFETGDSETVKAYSKRAQELKNSKK